MRNILPQKLNDDHIYANFQGIYAKLRYTKEYKYNINKQRLINRGNKKEVTYIMNAIWSWFAALLYNYGMLGADMPSVHGGHEPVVPETLQNMVAQHKD